MVDMDGFFSNDYPKCVLLLTAKASRNVLSKSMTDKFLYEFSISYSIETKRVILFDRYLLIDIVYTKNNKRNVNIFRNSILSNFREILLLFSIYFLPQIKYIFPATELIPFLVTGSCIQRMFILVTLTLKNRPWFDVISSIIKQIQTCPIFIWLNLPETTITAPFNASKIYENL